MPYGLFVDINGLHGLAPAKVIAKSLENNNDVA